MFEKRPIIALDFSGFEEVKLFLKVFPEEEKLYVKVGMELYYAVGPEIVYYIKSLGHSVFLDLKLHDIPHMVKATMQVLANMRIDMTTVHATGGIEMLKAAREGIGQETRLIAVTQLTSTNEEEMRQNQNIQTSLLESVLHYAKGAIKAQIDGVVCSAHEVKAIKEVAPEGFICVTPGIRPQGAEIGDQKRVVTPKEAKIMGSNYIVVGRPITRAQNPWKAYQAIKKEWNA